MEANMKTYDGFVVKENEYIKNDMIYCSKCHGEKLLQYKNYKRVRAICKCRQEELEKEEEEKRKLVQIERFRSLQQSSLLGKRYENVLFENTDLNVNETFVKAFERCRNYCKNYREVLDKSYGMFLTGNSGSGKTHLMACMVNYLLKQNIPCLFTNFYEIMREIKKSWSNNSESEYIYKLTTIPFLFIDDIGTEKVIERGEDNKMQERIYEIVNKRYNAMKPTVFSSNNTLKELYEDRGFMKKTIDRITEMSSAIIQVETDRSYRLTSRKKDLPF